MTDSADLSASFGRRSRVQTRASGAQRFRERLRRVAGQDMLGDCADDPRQAPDSTCRAVGAPERDDRWSPRRTLAFVVIASAVLWGLIGMAVYAIVALVNR